MRRALNFCLLINLFVLAGASIAMAERRIALVIGNAVYEKTATLANPGADAKAMSETLTRLGFEVLSGYDLTRPKFERLIRTFAKKLRGADVGLLYYAGHGMQVGGQNYLVPVDAELEAEDDIDFTMIALNTILKRMERYAKINLVFLDACRNNPYLAELSRSMGKRGDTLSRGFAPVKFRNESLIVYATQPGYTADDGKGKHSPFTSALLDHIETPGLDIPILMRKVRASVKQVTNNLQIPWNHSSLTKAFLFKAGSATSSAASKFAAPPQLSNRISDQFRGEARMAWTIVKDSKDPSTLKNYIKHYGRTFYASLAARRLKTLREEKIAVVLPAKPHVPKVSKSAKAPVHDCDRLAANPDDSEKVTAGVGFDDIRTSEAIAACQQAVKAYPQSARFSYQLGRAHHNNESFEEAIRWYEKAMQKGSAAAMSGLGQLYRKGEGVTKKYNTAKRLFERAIEKDSTAAMINLGVMYDNGEGFDKDQRTATRWYRAAANKGSTLGMTNLGSMYQNGSGVDKDQIEAVRWYRKAAAKGNASGMSNLGIMYENGDGVDKDLREAVRWYRKAADMGGAEGMYNLGLAYTAGEGIDKDYREAAKWFFKAADKNNIHAYYSLALAHSNGQGVAKDPTAAAGYMFKAIRGGYEFAVKQMTTNANGWSLASRKELQRLMAAEGVYSGAIDGQFGSGTKRAIRALAKKR